MKTVYYNFNGDYDMAQEYKDSPEEGMSMFVEKNWKNTSCPFSKISLYKTGDLFKNIFQYYSKLQKDYLHKLISKDTLDNAVRGTIASARACPALNSMIKNSLMIKCPTDMVISWRGQEVVCDSSRNMHIQVSNDHPCEQSITEDGFKIYGETTTLKFKLPLRFKTAVPMIFLQPSLHGPVPWTVVNGVIDPGRSFPVWVIVTVPSSEAETKTIHIKKDTVLAYLWSPEKYKLKYRSSGMGIFDGRKFSGN